MGLDYSINLYFPIRHLKTAFEGVASLAPTCDSPKTMICLPEGNCVEMPFTASWKTDIVKMPWGGNVQLETSLLFPLDDQIRDYGPVSTEVSEQGEFGEIGYIYLKVRLGCLFAEFSFTAATSRMSRLFVQSSSVRDRFQHLLEAADGVAAWVDQETCEFYRLDDPTQAFWPTQDRNDCVDRLTLALCGGLGNPLPVSTINPSWLTWHFGTIPKLAQAIYDERRFEDLPILADALEEAGCRDGDILAHCRSPGPHVRGCWVVDLLLGKT